MPTRTPPGVENSQRLESRALKSPDSDRLIRDPRPGTHKISDLVYEFLGEVASLNAERRQRNNARSKFQRSHVRKSNKQNRKPDAFNSVKLGYQIHQKPEILHRPKFDGTSRSPRYSDVVKDYIEAVSESSLHQSAKRYVSEAISFGVNAGLLAPTDSKGNAYHVSSTLDLRMIKKMEEKDARNNGIRGKRCNCERSKGKNSKNYKCSASCVCGKTGCKPKSDGSRSKHKRPMNYIRGRKRTSSAGPARKRRRKV